ncbi:SUN domain-containing protein 2 [Orussus abietinus]|uniref:SUN domain-containing protein 2 n=1 Tax=Orussus abietinus TaxID=222816 RepID=UPI000625ACAA|nr:SUN domain-containing protein 2 [Orussus abietinus]
MSTRLEKNLGRSNKNYAVKMRFQAADRSRKSRSDVLDNFSTFTSILAAKCTLLDIWLLLKARRLIEVIGKGSLLLVNLLWPILKVIFIIGLSTGAVLGYMFGHSYANFPSHEWNIDMVQASPGLSLKSIFLIDSLTQDPRTDVIEKEINALRSKTAYLERSLQKMALLLRMQYLEKIQEDRDLADFASETAGAAVLNTPDTESFYQDHGQVTLFGIPIFKTSFISPRKVIQAWSQPGECWAFQGSFGKIEIQLAHIALIDRVTIEHIPASASVTGSIDSAPKDFKILARLDNDYELIGTFLYNINGPATQSFKVENDKVRDRPFQIVMLVVTSNWGHPEYTCLYRFRVHGKIFDHDDQLKNMI